MQLHPYPHGFFFSYTKKKQEYKILYFIFYRKEGSVILYFLEGSTCQYQQKKMLIWLKNWFVHKNMLHIHTHTHTHI